MKKLFGKNSDNTNKLTRTLTSAKFITTVAVVLAVGALGAWHYHDTTNPDRVFWGMVNNSLQTSSFSRHNIVKSGGQSADQIIDVGISPVAKVFSVTNFDQTGVDEAQAVTENIGTPYADYVRYTSITTSQKSPTGKPYDFSKVLYVWGGTEADTSQTNGQQFNQSVLGVIPTGNLNAAQRSHLIELMKKKGTYSYKVSKPSRELPFGRPSYTFTVTVLPTGYVAALKEFGKDLGLTQLEELNPDDYKQAQKMQFQIVVDGWSHQVIRTVQASGSKTEDISGHNARKTFPATPKDTISIDELQTRLQTIQ